MAFPMIFKGSLGSYKRVLWSELAVFNSKLTVETAEFEHSVGLANFMYE